MQQAVSHPATPAAFNIWRGTLAGASASLIGIGLGRFACTPLLPPIIGAQAVAGAIAAVGFVGAPALMVSAVRVGAFTPGIVPLAPGRVNEPLAHRPSAVKDARSRATTRFAVMQAVAAYGLSFVFSRSGGHYLVLFVIGAAVRVRALVVDLFATLRAK